MTGTELTFIKWAGDKILGLMAMDASRAEACRNRVASYFDELGDCLHLMAQSMMDSKIPRVQGHRLSSLIEAFEITMATNFYGESKLKSKEGDKLLKELRSSARNAEHIDFCIRDGSLQTSPEDISSYIEDIERTAGKFLGIAGALRAVGPFNAKGKTS